MHHYVAYGLHVASELALPELARAAPAEAATAPDLRVVLGSVPDDIGDPHETRVTWAARPGAWRHEIAGVARYLVHDDGREVVVEPTGGTEADLRAFLFGTTLGAVLHQRRQFVLHACAVAMPGGAVAVAGSSGAGKSTTLAELARRGHPVLSDDKTVVQFGTDGPEVLSGYPMLRLWEDAVERLGEATAALPPLREGVRKYLYRAPAFQDEPAPLRLLVVLHQRAEPGGPPSPEAEAAPGGLRVERLGPHEAVGMTLRQTYRRRILDGSGLRAEHFGWATRLAAAVPVVRVVRPRHRQTVEAVADLVEAQLAEVAAAPRP